MFDGLSEFLIHWGLLAVALWLASRMFSGIRFESTGALVLSALLLGFANAFIKPLVILYAGDFRAVPARHQCIDGAAGGLAGQRFQGFGLLDGILCQHLHFAVQFRRGLLPLRW